MKKFNLKKTLGALSAAGLLVAATCTQTSCSDLWSEQHPGTYYINSGETVASFLEEGEYKDSFTDFVYILKKCNIWGELRTYGEHTCFAPDNAAFDEYLAKRYAEAPDSSRHYFESIETLPVYICDSIAKTHLCNTTFYCTDMSGDGAFPYPNLLDRYLTYYSFADTVWYQDDNGVDTFNIRLVYKINQVSQIVEADDTVQNGVVHIVNKVLQPSNKFLPGLLKENDNASIFYDALMATGLNEELEKYLDESYPHVGYDSTIEHFKATTKTHPTLVYDTGAEKGQYGTIPEKRYFKYTMFVVNDSVLNAKYGITNLDGLRNEAKRVYPEGQSIEDDSDPSSSLYKLISYHILPCYLEYNKLNLTDSKDVTIIATNRKYLDELDVEDFYEPLLPHSIMRISSPYESTTQKTGVFINRKGTVKLNNLIPGIRIATPSEYGNISPNALNGCYHYVDELLVYDDFVRETVLNTRMRVMANTMSPDFINSGATGRLNSGKESDKYTVGFLKGYCQNFEALNDNTQFWVRYADKTFGCWMGYEMTIRGIYDIAIKLPVVPTDGTYETRIWVNSMSNYQGAKNPRGIVQFYFREGENGEWKPCGIPVDLRIPGTDPRIGNKKDDDLRKNAQDEAQQNLAIDMFDKAMRNRGYMKAMDTYAPNSSNLRDDTDCNRKIVCSEFMRADGDYYLRMRQVMEVESADFPFNFVEIVPKNIYAGEVVREDKH